MSDERLAERLARAEIGDSHWLQHDSWVLRSIELHAVKNWLERIETIRRAGLELVEREDGR